MIWYVPPAAPVDLKDPLFFAREIMKGKSIKCFYKSSSVIQISPQKYLEYLQNTIISLGFPTADIIEPININTFCFVVIPQYIYFFAGHL